jgi:hypothetical protein
MEANMAITYRIEKEKGFTLVLWKGVVTAEEFLAHVRRLVSDEDWPPGRRLHLTDLRDTSLDASMDESTIQKAADNYGKYPEKIKGMKVAIVASDAFSKAVVFERIITQYGATAIVFNFLNTARIWLDIDDDDIKRSLQQLRIIGSEKGEVSP